MVVGGYGWLWVIVHHFLGDCGWLWVIMGDCDCGIMVVGDCG